MKKYFKIILTISLVVSVSCADEFVENGVSPVVNFPVTDLITDQQSAEVALNGIYSAAQNDGVFQGDMVYLQGMYGDELDHTGSFPTFAAFEGNDIATDNIDNTGVWNGHYDFIFDVNFFIDGINRIELPVEVLEAFEGQALVMRASAYFNLTRLYRGVPVYTEPAIVDGNFDGNPRSSQAEVYEQILADLNGGVTRLQGVDDGFTIGEYSARFLRAKVNTELGNYADALTDLNAIEGNFSLESNYANAFSNSIGTETIFKLDFDLADQNSLAFFFYPAFAGGRREVAASQKLIDALNADGGDRLSLLQTIDDLDANGNGPSQANVINKYDDVVNGANDFNVMRYADVLLYQAEALARLNQFGPASDKINEVRQRAGVPDVTLNQSNFIDLIANERLLEFYAEGTRWYDIRRLGIAEEIILAKPNSVYIASREDLWPIPSDELDTNPFIGQEQQNPGY